MRKKRIFFIVLLIILLNMFAFFYFSNNAIVVTEINVESQKIDTPINLLHLSDIHSKVFGDNNSKIKEKVDNLEYDLVLVTGDLIDSRRANNITETVDFLRYLTAKTPVYYVRGNHEYSLETDKRDVYNELVSQLGAIENNFFMLTGDYQTINIKGNEIKVLGADTIFTDEGDRLIVNDLENFNSGDEFRLILDHFPNHFDVYENGDVLYDLILSGHIHGGQVRLPLIGGLLSPNVRLNPKYDAGLFENEKGKMVVSRGLGNSILPLRVFNRPELVLIKLS